MPELGRHKHEKMIFRDGMNAMELFQDPDLLSLMFRHFDTKTWIAARNVCSVWNSVFEKTCPDPQIAARLGRSLQAGLFDRRIYKQTPQNTKLYVNMIHEQVKDLDRQRKLDHLHIILEGLVLDRDQIAFIIGESFDKILANVLESHGKLSSTVLRAATTQELIDMLPEDLAHKHLPIVKQLLYRGIIPQMSQGMHTPVRCPRYAPNHAEFMRDAIAKGYRVDSRKACGECLKVLIESGRTHETLNEICRRCDEELLALWLQHKDGKYVLPIPTTTEQLKFLRKHAHEIGTCVDRIDLDLFDFLMPTRYCCTDIDKILSCEVPHDSEEF